MSQLSNHDDALLATTNDCPQNSECKSHQPTAHNLATQTAAGATVERLAHGLPTPVLANYGRELRRIAEQFERTRRRHNIRNEASSIRLSDLHQENFIQLLEQMFEGRERVAISFFFWTDVALHGISFGSNLVSKLITSSFRYIRARVCLSIHTLDGWDALLNRYVPSVFLSACAILGICAFAIYMKRNLST